MKYVVFIIQNSIFEPQVPGTGTSVTQLQDEKITLYLSVLRATHRFVRSNVSITIQKYLIHPLEKQIPPHNLAVLDGTLLNFIL